MSVIIKDRKIVEDPWTHASDEDPIPGDGPVTVSWNRWQADRSSLSAREAPVGVRLPNTVEPDEITADLNRWGLVTIEFPTFKDGRGYSLARLIRGRLKYVGELRAVGDIMRDQLYFLSRCGFDAFVLKAGKDPVDALAAFTELTVRYQPSSDESQPIWRRHIRAGIAAG